MVKRQKTAKDAIVEIMKTVGVSQQKMADKIGVKKQQGVFNMLNAKNGMRIDSFIKMLDALGYDVLIRNRVNEEEVQIILDGSGEAK